MNRMRSFYAATLPLAVVALAAFACAPPAEEPVAETPAIEEETPVAPAPEPLTATATLTTADGVEIGTATFTQVGSQTTASFHLVGVSPAGTHAIHVHENGECTPPDFTSAGGHFNPNGKKHGIMAKDGHHAGDMPNLHIPASGTLQVEVVNSAITLEKGKPNSVFGPDGTALIIHAAKDDYKSDPTGEAGGRVACGVIQ